MENLSTPLRPANMILADARRPDNKQPTSDAHSKSKCGRPSEPAAAVRGEEPELHQGHADQEHANHARTEPAEKDGKQQHAAKHDSPHHDGRAHRTFLVSDDLGS